MLFPVTASSTGRLSKTAPRVSAASYAESASNRYTQVFALRPAENGHRS